MRVIGKLEVRIVRRLSAEGFVFDDVHCTVDGNEHYLTRYRTTSGGEAYERQKFLKHYDMKEVRT